MMVRQMFNEVALVAALILGWFFLQWFILPKMGVST
jgi:hypothetical protein